MSGEVGQRPPISGQLSAISDQLLATDVQLAVFEEERWPPRIDDPLPWKSDIDPQRRLHDTINSLNRHQRQQLVHFSADGLAQGIRWELIDGGL
ncbi:MAG: hypothetical protein WCB27_08125 [Thermoguttaceae bacterium]